MNSCNSLCQLIAGVNWLWFIIAVIVAFFTGAVWYSVLFKRAWIHVFKIDISSRPSTGSIIRTLAAQLVVNILFGLVFFVLTKISVCVAVLALIGFCGWEKGELNFQFAKWREYWKAAMIRAGYSFIAGIIYIVFASI